MMHHTIKNQHEDRRLAAIEADDDLNYAKAFYELDLRKMKIATEIEDIIFDYLRRELVPRGQAISSAAGLRQTSR